MNDTECIGQISDETQSTSMHPYNDTHHLFDYLREQLPPKKYVSSFRKGIDSLHKQVYFVGVDINAKKRRVNAERCVENPWVVKREVKAALKHLLEQFAEAIVG